MLKSVNMPCTYSSNHLRFPDGTDFTGFTPGIRGTADFVVTVIEDDENFKIPGSDLLGRPPRYTKCRVQGHYADESPDQLVSLFCDDLGPLAGVDQAPERVDVVSGQPSESTADRVRDARALLESAGFLITEAKKTFDTFMTYLMTQDGRCSADGGDSTFHCLKLNDENFDFADWKEFREQIEKEGLYDWSWVAGLIPNKNLKDGKVPVSWLPIFGDPNRYVTKWLRNGTPSGAVEEVFRDRRMKVKDRIDYFAIPAEEQLSLNTLKEELEKIGLPCRIRNHYRKGDFLETNLEFSQEDCNRWHDIPVSSGYKIVWLIRNKFVINKHKFNSVQKVVDYFKENKDLYELAEANEIIKKSGKKLILESKPNYHFEKMMKITELLYDNIEDLRYDDARDIAEYISEKMESHDVDQEYVAETLEQILDDCGIRIHFDLASRLASKILGL